MSRAAVVLARWVCSAILLSWSALAPAQSASDREAARTLAAEGKEAAEAGDLARALDRFTRADTLFPAPTLKVARARLLLKQGLWVESLQLFHEASRSKAAPDDPDSWLRARSEATTEADALRKRLPTLTIDITGAKGATVLLDGKVLSPAALGVAMPVNPGRHSVEASVAGGVPTRRELSVDESQAKREVLDVNEAPVAPPVAAPTAAPSAPPPGSSAPAPRIAPTPTLGYVVTALGAVAIGASGYFGMRALSEKRTRDDLCGATSCTSAGHDADQSARRDASLSTAFGSLGLVGIGVGAYLILEGRKPSSASGVWVNTVAGPRGAAAFVTRSF